MRHLCHYHILWDQASTPHTYRKKKKRGGRPDRGGERRLKHLDYGSFKQRSITDIASEGWRQDRRLAKSV